MAKDPAQPADKTAAESEDLDADLAEAVSVRFKPSWAPDAEESGAIDDQWGSAEPDAEPRQGGPATDAPSPHAERAAPAAEAAPSSAANNGRSAGERIKTPPGGIAVESPRGEHKHTLLGIPAPITLPSAIVRAPNPTATPADGSESPSQPEPERSDTPNQAGPDHAPESPSSKPAEDQGRRERLPTKLGLAPPTAAHASTPAEPRQPEPEPMREGSTASKQAGRGTSPLPRPVSPAEPPVPAPARSARGKKAAWIAIGGAMAAAAALLAFRDEQPSSSSADLERPEPPALASSPVLEPVPPALKEAPRTDAPEAPSASLGDAAEQAPPEPSSQRPAPAASAGSAIGPTPEPPRPQAQPALRPAPRKPPPRRAPRAQAAPRPPPKPPAPAPEPHQSTDIVRKAPF
ncbi:MAG TPA: hypothetical protein VF989_20415 [Polyangiaceae bacterium]